ncbi:MAG: ATP synthase F0 subunit B [Chloroflexi bacterium]|nr:MAG: ATP synthase F0 subunit B [Chloroflexota bacterium]
MEGLGIDWKSLALQVVNFLLLLFILYKFLYNPILNTLKARQERIQKGLEEAEKAQQKVAEAQAEAERILEEAKQRSQEILAQVTQQGEKMREEILAQAREEARRMIEKAREEIKRERELALAEVRRQAIDLAVLTARKIVGQALDEQAHHRLISEFLSQLDNLS